MLLDLALVQFHGMRKRGVNTQHAPQADHSEEMWCRLKHQPWWSVKKASHCTPCLLTVRVTCLSSGEHRALKVSGFWLCYCLAQCLAWRRWINLAGTSCHDMWSELASKYKLTPSNLLYSLSLSVYLSLARSRSILATRWFEMHMRNLFWQFHLPQRILTARPWGTHFN